VLRANPSDPPQRSTGSPPGRQGSDAQRKTLLHAVTGKSRCWQLANGFTGTTHLSMTSGPTPARTSPHGLRVGELCCPRAWRRRPRVKAPGQAPGCCIFDDSGPVLLATVAATSCIGSCSSLLAKGTCACRTWPVDASRKANYQIGVV
jgi:hypothetical protein